MIKLCTVALAVALVTSAPVAHAWGDREQGALAGLVAGAVLAQPRAYYPRPPAPVVYVPSYYPPAASATAFGIPQVQQQRQVRCTWYTTLDYQGRPVGRHQVCY